MPARYLAIIAIALSTIPGCSGTAARAARKAAPTVGSTAIMCAGDEPGPRLLIDGLVVDERGRPVPGVA